MSSQTFDGVRVLSIGPRTIPIEIFPSASTSVTIDGGQAKSVQSGETLSVSQGDGVSVRSSAGRAGSAYANASVTTSGSRGAASVTIRGETASATYDGEPSIAGHNEHAQGPGKITIHVPEGTAIEVKNHVNGTFRMGAIKGPLAIDQMVNARIAVDEATEVNIKMLVNCHGQIHATGKTKSGMMVNCDVRFV